MSSRLFSKLLRKFFGNPFQKMLSGEYKAHGVCGKKKPSAPKRMQVENLEPRLVPSTTTTENPLPGQRHEVIFVDSTIPNRQNLLNQMQLQDISTEVVELNALQNGLEQISKYLSDKSNLDAIHVLSHGQQGKVFLGNYTLGTHEIDSNLDYFATIGRSLAHDGDILLYGCDISQGFVGQDFVTRLAEVTGANIAASEDATGSLLVGGDWVLETTTGTVDTQVIQADLGANTLNNFTVSIGQNSPKLYYQARSTKPEVESKFSTITYANNGGTYPLWVDTPSDQGYARNYTQDNYATNYRPVERQRVYYYPFQGNRTITYTDMEPFQDNVGNGTRYGTQNFTLASNSTYQFWTTPVAGTIYHDNFGVVERHLTKPSNSLESFFYVISVYRGGFDPTQPLANLVAANEYRRVGFEGSPNLHIEGELAAGNYTLVVSFSYNSNYSDQEYFFYPSQMWGDFNVNIINMNQAPVWDAGSLNQSISGAGTRSFSIPWSKVSDPEGDAISVSARLLVNGQEQNLPSWLTFNPNSLAFSGNAPANTGAINLRLIASDGQLTAIKDFTATFTNDNDQPVVAAAIPTQSWFGSGGFTFPLPAGTFTDPDPSSTTFSYSATLTNGSALPPWLTIDPVTGTLSGNPPTGAANLAIRVAANDGSGQANATVTTDFTLRLLNNNDVPTVTGTTLAVNEDATLSFIAANFGFTDGDTHDSSNGTTGTGKGLAAVRIVTLPANGTLWLDTNSSGSLDAGEAVAVNQVIGASDLGRLRYTPRADWAGGASADLSPTADSFMWTATDGVAEAASPAVTSIEVVLVNDPPRLATSTGRTLVVRPNTGNALSAVAVDPGISLVDVDAPLTTNASDFDAVLGATLTVVDSVSGNFQTGDLLAVTVTGSITSSWNASSGALTLSGTGTAAQYQQVLRSLQFSSSNTSNDNLRTVSITLRTRNVGSVSAAVFDGTDDYIETMRAAVPMGGDWTVSVWALADGSILGDGNQQNTILAQGTSHENFFIQRAGSNNDLRLGDSWTVNGGMPTDSKWHQFTVVKSGTSSTNGTLYIDGIKVATGQLPNALPGTGMRIGRLYKQDNTQEWGASYWKGSISDLRVYNRALNGLEVTSSLDTNTTLTGYESNLVSWYPLDGTADNKAANSWNLGRDFDLRAPQWQQGPWDLGFIDIGSNTNDWTSSPTGDIFRSFSRAGATPTIEVRNSGQVIRAWQSNANVGHFDFLPNTAQNYALTNTGTGGDFTQRPGEVTTLPADYPTAAQYTAPISGIFGVDARFWRAYSTAGDSKYRVFKLSGSTLTEVDAGAQVTGTNPSGGTVSSLRQIVLSQGEKLIFAIHRNGSQAWDETSLSLQVDLLATKVTNGSDTYYYSHSNGHYYGLPSSTANWDTAKANAEALTFAGQSGYLATPTDSASMQIARAILREANVGNAWAGARQINSNNEPTGSFYWATGPKAGQPFNGTWNGGEPNNYNGSENHVDITQNNYNDNNGASSLRYVVEFGDGRLPLPVELTGTIAVSRDPGNAMLFKDADVAYSARTRHYYRVDATARTWTDAVTNAENTSYEGQTGYLARVTDLNELRIAGWFNRLRNQADQWVGLQQTNTSVEPAGGWQWVTGDQAGMTTDANFTTSTFWSPGEPNNGWSGTEHYGGLNNYGFALNDYKNDQPNIGSLIEYGIDGTSLAIPLFAAPATLPDKTVSGSRNIAVRVGNTAPSVTGWAASTSEDTTLAFAATDFTSRFTDPELDSLASITFTAIPLATAGVLRLDGTTLAVNAVVTAGGLARLQFIPAANYNGPATFSYTASDGNLTSSSAATVTITVVAVNDPPVLDTAPVVVVTGIAEDIADGDNTGMTVAALVFNGSITDVDGSPVEAIAVTLVDNTYGLWQYKVGAGNWTAFTATQGVVRLGGSSRLLDATDAIRFVPDANFNGTATISYRAWDKSAGSAGGTTNPFAMGGNTAVSSAEETATITVTSVNDVPATSAKTIVFDEDTSYVFKAADFAFVDVDNGDTLVSIQMNNPLPAFGTITLFNGSSDAPVSANQVIALADIIAGKLKYTPPANAYGTSYSQMSFSVGDGNSFSTASTITFNVTDTNDAPTAIAWATGGSIAEGTTNAQGVLVGTLVATDPNSGDILSFSRASNSYFTLTPDGVVRYVGLSGLDYEATPTQTIGVTVTDSGGLTYTANLTVSVTNVNEAAPTILTSSLYVALNSLTTIGQSNLRAVDEQQSGSSLVFTIQDSATGGSFWIDADNSGTINGAEKILGKITPSTPNVSDTFTQADIDNGKLKFLKDNTNTVGSLIVSASDGTNVSSRNAVLSIFPSSPPVVAPVDDQQWKTINAQSFVLPANTFTDPDLNILTLTASKTDGSQLPNWLTFNPNTWTFSGTPSGVNPGDTLSIRVSASDGRNPAVYDDFVIHFVSNLTAPVVANPIPNQVFQGSGNKTYQVSANTFTDPNSAAITYGATLANGSGLPAWLSFDPNTRTFSGNPPASAVPGPLWIKVTGTSSGGSSSAVFRLDVLNANDVPVETPSGTIPDVTLSGTAEQTFTVNRNQFADPDGGVISLRASATNGQSLPDWIGFSFDNATGIGTFRANLPSGSGSQVVRLYANDSVGGSGYADFTINYSGGSNSEPAVFTSNGLSGMDSQNPRQLYTIPGGNASVFIVNQGTVKAITRDYLLEADPDDQGTGITYTVTTLPQKGQLWLDLDYSNTVNGSESVLQTNGTFTQEDIDLQKLKYIHTANNAIADSFVFSIADGGENGSIPVVGVTFPITVAPSSLGAPTLISVSRSNPAGAITNADSVNFRVMFSEDVNGVDATDFVFTGFLAASASIISIQAISGSTYDITVGGSGLANANGTLGIGLAANPTITNNGSTGINTSVAALSNAIYTLDNTAPSATATASVLSHDGATAFTVTFAFTENVNGLTANSFSATNASLSNLVIVYDSNNNPTNQYRITVTPTAFATITVSLPSGSTTDNAGNVNSLASITVLANLTITGPGNATSATSSVSIAENTATVFTFNANRSVTWSIVGGADAGRFSIGQNTGELAFLAAPDFESPGDADANNTYVVIVQATDGTNVSTSQTVTVTVTNVNEAPSGISLSPASIAENAVVHAVVGTLLTTDPDANNTFTYSLVSGAGDTDNASFRIVNGQLQTNASFNFEAGSTYSIRVRSVDQGNLSFERAFSITITDVNEAPTIFMTGANSDSAAFTETNSALTANGTLSVADQDAGSTVTVTVATVVASGTTTGLGATNPALLAMFTVNNPNTVIASPATTGTITWAFNSGLEAFDYLAAGESLTLTYTVRVADLAGLTADRSVTITVTGTNDVPVLSLVREIQQTTYLGLTNDRRTYSFYSPENGNAEFGVVINSPNTGFPDAAAMAAAFQAHPAYGTLPYTITLDGTGTQLVLTFKTDGDFGQRSLQRWGDNGIPLAVVQDGGADTVTLVETNAALTVSGTLGVEDLDRTNTVTVTVPAVVASGTTMGLGANNAALLAMFTVNNPNTVISSTTTTGTITWAFNSGSETFDYLAAGESLTLTYTVRVTDSATAMADRTVTIIVTGTQDLPVFAVATGSTAAASITETDTTLTASGVLTLIDADLSNTVQTTVQSVSVTGGTFAGSVPLTNAELLAMLTLRPVQGGGSIGTSSGTGISFLDNQQGGLYVNTTPPGVTGLVSQWKFYKPTPPANDARYLNSWVTPVILEKVGSNYVMRGVGRSRFTSTAGTYTFDFEVVSGSAQLVNANYTYGHIDGNVNNPGAPLNTQSVGNVGWSTPAGATWGYLQASLSSANIGTTYTQISNAGRLYASELILATPAAVPADPSAGDDIAWTFVSGSSGNAAFNFLPSGQTLEMTYSARATDSNTPAGMTDRAIVVTLMGTNDAPTDIALSATIVAENSASGTVVGSFSTIDADGGDAHTYALVAGTGDTDNALFQIVGGQLRTAASFSFETKSSYSIRVRTLDQGSFSYEKPFTITVTDVNEAPTGVSLANTTTSIAENTSTATRIKVADIVVADDALGSESITLTGADASSFELDGLALYLKSGVALDFETKASYAVIVNVEDTSLTGSTPVTVAYNLSVTDVNEVPAITVGAGDSAGASLLETNTTISASGSLTVTDPDPANTVAVSINSVAITGGNFNPANVPLTNSDLAGMFSVGTQVPGPSIGSSSSNGVSFLDNQQGGLYVNTTPPGVTGLVSQWKFYKPTPPANDARYLNSWVTPVILEKVGSNYVMRGVGRSRFTSTAGTYTFDFELVSGSAQLVNANYTYGHIDGNVNNPNAPLNTPSVGNVGWSTPAGATWGYLQASLSSANIGTTYTQISNAGRFYASELILDGISNLPADPPSGSSITWNFNSGLSGNSAFNFLNSNQTLELTYTVRSTDSHNPSASQDFNVVVLVTGTNDAALLDLDGSSANRTQDFTGKLNPISFTAAGTNLSDADNQTFDNIQLSFAKSQFPDGAKEKLFVSGATNGEIAPSLGGIGNGIGAFTLSGITYDYVVSVTNGVASITFTGQGGSELTAQQAEQILDNLQYNHLGDYRTSMPNRVFDVKATDGSGLASNTESLTIQITPTSPVILRISDDTGRSPTDRITNDTTLTFGGLAGVGDTVKIVDIPTLTLVGSGVVGSDGKFSITTQVLANNSYAFAAVASNANQITSTPSPTTNWLIYNAPIAQPILATGNGLPLIQGTAALGTIVTVVIGNATYAAPVDGSGNWLINLVTDAPQYGVAPSVAPGSYSYTAVASDLAGNASPLLNATLVVTTPVQPPPVFTSSSSTSDTTPILTGLSEPGSRVRLELRSSTNVLLAVYSNVAATSSGSWSVDLQTLNPDNSNAPASALVNGSSYNLLARATDSSGLFTSVDAAATLAIDTVTPAMPVISSLNRTQDSTPVFSGTAEPASMVELSIRRASGAPTLYRTMVDGSGNWLIDFGNSTPVNGFLNNLQDGNYIVEVVAVDAALNRSQARVQNPFTVDTQAPTTPVITSPALTNDSTPSITGTAENLSDIYLLIQGTTYTTTTSSSGQWTVNISQTLADGMYPVQVTAKDAVGNSSQPALQNLRVDTTAPGLPQFTSTNKTNDETPQFTGIAEPGSIITLTINGATFSTAASPNGAWNIDLGTALPNGGTNPIAPLVNGQTYTVTLTSTDAAGNNSQSASQSLQIDTTAPDAPVFTSSALTNQVPPIISGTAEPGSTLTLTIHGATYRTLVNPNGNWTVNTSTATPFSGSLGQFTDGNFPIAAFCTDSLQASGTSSQNLLVDLTAPLITSAVASFGPNLNLNESRSDATVLVTLTGMEDGQAASIEIGGTTISGLVYSGQVSLVVPKQVMEAIPEGNATFTIRGTDRAGNVGTQVFSYTVDKTGPARPSFNGVTSTQLDPTPNDPFTAVVNPTIQLTGTSGLGVVIHGPNGVVNPAHYTVTESNGLYSIVFTTNQTGGEYKVNLVDANGNESPSGNTSENFFRIDSIPILFDNPGRRSTSMGSTHGNLSIKNFLNGVVFDVPQQTNNSWIDLDGQALTFGLVGGSQGQNGVVETTVQGAVLRVNTITGAYTYTPVPMTSRTDSFLLSVRDTNNNQTLLQLSFNSLDTLDRDGIQGGTESTLAGIITGNGNSSNLAGDLNRDGTADSSQNSVSTLAWRRESDFQTATNPSTMANTDPSAIICMVVNGSFFDPSTTTSLAQLMSNVDPLSQLLQISVTNTNGMLPDQGNFYKPWDVMNFAVESLVSTGLTDINPDRPGTQIQVSFDVSNANVSMTGLGFNLYRKYVSADTISAYADAGITLLDLTGNPVTSAGWYDYTQRTAGGDGAQFRDFNNDGKVDAIIVTLTDNAFGDDNPVRNLIVDPGTPGSTIPTNPGGPNPSVPTPPGSNPSTSAMAGFSASSASSPNTISAVGTTVRNYHFNSTTPSSSVVPFANFRGEVRLVRADINNDGVADIISTMGTGGLPTLKVINGSTQATMLELDVYDRAFRGGIYVTTGDTNNDGIPEIITGAGAGGGPHVKVFNSQTGAELASFFAYDPSFTGGISVAAADMDGNGIAEIITGAGPGGGPHVKVFNPTNFHVIKEFMAYDPSFRNGIFVAAGDFLSDGKREIITGAGPGGGPHVKIWDYLTLNVDGQFMAYGGVTNNVGQVVDQFFSGGVRVALADVNGDNINDILTGAGPSGGPHVKAFAGFNLELILSLFAGDENDRNGVFVS